MKDKESLLVMSLLHSGQYAYIITFWWEKYNQTMKKSTLLC